MGQLIANFDEAKEQLTLTGDVQEAIKYPLVRNFVSQYQGREVEPGKLVIPCETGKLDGFNRLMGQVLERYGLSLEYGQHLSEALDDVVQRERDFEEFSKEAAAIWRSEYEVIKFQSFVEALSENCQGRTFYPLQLLSAFHLAYSQHACNFSVPGAGKTSIVYAAYAYLNSLEESNDKFVNHLLVVGPLSSFKAWEDEFAEVFSRAPSTQRLSGGLDTDTRSAYLRGFAPNSNRTELTLTHYQALASSEEEFTTFLKANSRRVMMVLDEAHKIKRSDGVWAASALRLAPSASARVVLTGTPAPNGYEDLSNLFTFLYPERNLIGFNSGALSALSQNPNDPRIPMMKDRIRPFFTRIRKSDLDLKDPIDFPVPTEMSEEQREIYRRIERAIVPKLRRDADLSDDFLTRARLIRLRQAATNPSLLLKPLEDDLAIRSGIDPLADIDHEFLSILNAFRPGQHLAKLAKLVSLVKELQASHQKILIWSVFLQNLDLIVSHLSGQSGWVKKISGATPVRNDDVLPEDQDIETREQIIDEFLQLPGSSILVANPQSVGESISLHRACHVAIYFDRDFNAGQFIQSKDRIHRYGLKKNQDTSYYFLMTSDSVEEDIHARLQAKEERLSELIDKDDIPLFSAVLGDDEDEQDIRAIIASYERRKS